MCGRFGLTWAWEDLFEYFSIIPTEQDKAAPGMPPRYNIAPTQPIVTIGIGPDGRRQALLARWGLVPTWVKDPKGFTLLINARSETAAEKPSFRAAMRHRRILIPASGFFEWQRFGKDRKSQPYWVTRADGELMVFGGLMETWAGEDGSEIDTACIITTSANDNFAPIHHRLPMIVEPEHFERWLDCRTREPKDVADLIAPAPDDLLKPVPVSDRVNRVANGDASIIEPVELAKESGQAKPDDDDGQLGLF